MADAPADPRSDGTARMVVAHSARNYKPTGLGSGCRRGQWGVTGVSSVRGVGPVRGPAGRTSVAGAPDPQRDGTARMVVARSARNYKPPDVGVWCRRVGRGLRGSAPATYSHQPSDHC